VSVLGSVATPQGLHYPDDLSSLLESRSNEGHIHEVRNERIRSDEDMRPGNEYRHEQGSKALKECFEAVFVVVVQDGESRKWFADGIVERRRYSPHASLAYTELFELARCVLDQSVWWIGHDGMDRIRLGSLQPLEGVSVNDTGCVLVQ
jgi:hypothetical protein